MNTSRTTTNIQSPHRSILTYTSSLLSPLSNREQFLKSKLEEMVKSESCRDIKIQKQQTTIKMLTNRLSTKSKCDDREIISLKDSLYNDLKSVNNQLITIRSYNQSLTIENAYLKEQIAKKDSIISQFEEVAKETAVKFSQMETSRTQQLKEDKRKVNKEREDLCKEIMILKNNNKALELEVVQLNNAIKAMGKEKNYVIKKINELQIATLKENDENKHKVTLLEKENCNLKKTIDCMKKESENASNYYGTIELERDNKIDECDYMMNKYINEKKELMKTIDNLKKILNELTYERDALLKKVKDCEKLHYDSNDVNNNHNDDYNKKKTYEMYNNNSKYTINSNK